jgi:2-keto-4-pentenoate hydratase/2-oxohepta-3-ene-1,7-dioic acid hydratase in catechol pathway
MRYVRYKFKSTIHFGKIEGENIHQISCKPWDPSHKETKELIPLKKVSILAPCEPSKVIGVALNYPEVSSNNHKMAEPLFFLKPGSSVIGPMDQIINPFTDLDVWGECELAIVIGKTVKKASEKEVADSILGYTIANDVSANNVHNRDHHLARSKAADTFCVIGPWIDTDFTPNNQKIKGYHNKTLLREGKLNQRFWKETEIIIFLSKWMTLYPGDIILTGAPKRVRGREFFVNGDSFNCRIEGLGEINNTYYEENEL